MYIYCPYHVFSKSFVLCSGYYGNTTNITGFKDKETAKRNYPSAEYKIKRIKVK